MTLFEKSTSMQIIPFPAHYQLGYHNFDFSSFSRISCIISVALSAFKCGPFASSESPNEKIGVLLRWSKAGFLFSLENFSRHVFVNIIRRYPATCKEPASTYFYGCGSNPQMKIRLGLVILKIKIVSLQHRQYE